MPSIFAILPRNRAMTSSAEALRGGLGLSITNPRPVFVVLKPPEPTKET